MYPKIKNIQANSHTNVLQRHKSATKYYELGAYFHKVAFLSFYSLLETKALHLFRNTSSPWENLMVCLFQQ